MDLNFSEEQEMFRKTVRKFVEREWTKEAVRKLQQDERGYSPDHWQKMADLGWLGMVFPEEYGGSGASLLDLLIFCEEMGRGLLPSPHLSTVVLAGLAILECGSPAQKARFLPAIVAGKSILSFALTEPDWGWVPEFIQTAAVPSGDGFVLNGTKLFIPYAHVSDHILCVARGGAGGSDPGISLLIAERGSPGLSCTPLHGFTGERLCEVAFHDVRIPKDALLGSPGKGWGSLEKVLKIATIMLCGEMVGGAERVVEMTLDYANTRVQFQQTIGSFQRVQDRIIDMTNALDEAKWATYEAAWLLNEGRLSNLAVSIAKALCSDAYSRICLEAHHVLAGMGYMKDHDLYLYTQKARTLQHYLGDGVFHRKVIARELLLEG
jgi:alkylation response protein AidB-like acyl-CoA dehydrogenase